MSRISQGMPEVVIRSSRELYADRDGDLHLGVHLTLTPERFAEYRDGYRCLRCHTAQDEAFPVVCKETYKDGGGCGFRMRAEQADLMRREFRGHEVLWPEQEGDDEERLAWKPGTGIWLPRGAA
jgi:hypothetical protein